MRADRVGFLGYKRPTTPNMDKLARHSIVLENHIAAASFTQPAFPSIFTSSHPLSYGGDDLGAWRRPPTIFEVLHNEGYENYMISTFPWVSRFYGYRKGINQEEMLFTINALVGAASATISLTIGLYLEGKITKHNLIQFISPLMEKFFSDIIEYSEFRLRHQSVDRHMLANERVIRDGYDYKKIIQTVVYHKTFFKFNKESYIDKYFQLQPNAHNWIAKDWRYARDIYFISKLAFQSIFETICRAKFPLSDNIFGKRYVDGQTISNLVVNKIKNNMSEKPFMIWAHFFDAHVPYSPGKGRFWRDEAPNYLNKIGFLKPLRNNFSHSKKPTTSDDWNTWSALYDAGIHYIDSQIGQIVDALKQSGKAENTILIIGSDHGEELGEHGQISHRFMCYDHCVRVPFIIFDPGHQQKNIKALTTHIDLAPTIMVLAGLKSPKLWEGKNILRKNGRMRTHVLIENFYGGSCLFEHRPLYIGVRTSQFKYLWKEFRDPTDNHSKAGHELYDLNSDPKEQTNIYQKKHPKVELFNHIIAERLTKLPQISESRIIAAFGDIGHLAIQKYQQSM